MPVWGKILRWNEIFLKSTTEEEGVKEVRRYQRGRELQVRYPITHLPSDFRLYSQRAPLAFQNNELQETMDWPAPKEDVSEQVCYEVDFLLERGEEYFTMLKNFNVIVNIEQLEKNCRIFLLNSKIKELRDKR